MSSRTAFLKEFRGEIIGEIHVQSLKDEQFQNATLRPILKLQNDLLLSVFKAYLKQIKIDFDSHSADKKRTIIENAVLKDAPLQNLLKGIVVGLFTLEEHVYYSENSSGLTKRIRSMLIERLQNQL
jgi:hypothetical protein